MPQQHIFQPDKGKVSTGSQRNSRDDRILSVLSTLRLKRIIFLCPYFVTGWLPHPVECLRTDRFHLQVLSLPLSLFVSLCFLWGRMINSLNQPKSSLLSYFLTTFAVKKIIYSCQLRNFNQDSGIKTQDSTVCD